MGWLAACDLYGTPSTEQLDPSTLEASGADAGATAASTAGTNAQGGAGGSAGGSRETTAGAAGVSGSPGMTGGAAGKTGGGAGGSGGMSGATGGGAPGSGGAGGGSGAPGSGGAAGDGGKCADHPILNKSLWTVTASSADVNNPITNAYDDILTNRFSTGKDQFGDEWVYIDFGANTTLTQLTLMLGDSADDYARGYAARFSSTAIDPAAPSVPVLVSGNGAAATDTVLKLPTKLTTRYALISQTGSAQGHWWSIAEIQAACAD